MREKASIPLGTIPAENEYERPRIPLIKGCEDVCFRIIFDGAVGRMCATDTLRKQETVARRPINGIRGLEIGTRRRTIIEPA